MTIAHHLDDATLMSFAAGSLPEALSAVVAAHLAVCARCATEVRRLEAVGASVLGTLDANPLKAPVPSGGDRSFEANSRQQKLGRQIAALVADVDRVPWKRFALGLWHLPLPLSPGAPGDLRLLKVAPGNALPDHGHGASELTIVLKGAYHDKLGYFQEGDVADLDDSVEHTPVADDKSGCICLIANDRRTRFKGIVARAIQPFTRY